jgi:hypothetical protein
MSKPKTTQPKTPGVVQGRDLFQTPNYATRLLLPYIPQNIRTVWECAAGEGKMANMFLAFGYGLIATDINSNYRNVDFVNDIIPFPSDTAIITNPPFSLKKQFFERCIAYSVPFALLIPADISQWICRGIEYYGCEILLPDRRINYITPTGRSQATKNSQAQFHSMWLTYRFKLPSQITVVHLSLEETQTNI